MAFDELLKKHHCTLVGYHLLSEWFPDKFNLEVPDPPSELNDDELEELTSRITERMPLEFMITDLWDWDVHFEKELGDEWFYSAVFGSSRAVEECASELSDFFLCQVEELSLDYDQWGNEEDFLALVQDEARKFIVKWRYKLSESVK